MAGPEPALSLDDPEQQAKNLPPFCRNSAARRNRGRFFALFLGVSAAPDRAQRGMKEREIHGRRLAALVRDLVFAGCRYLKLSAAGNRSFPANIAPRVRSPPPAFRAARPSANPDACSAAPRTSKPIGILLPAKEKHRPARSSGMGGVFTGIHPSKNGGEKQEGAIGSNRRQGNLKCCIIFFNMIFYFPE